MKLNTSFLIVLLLGLSACSLATNKNSNIRGYETSKNPTQNIGGHWKYQSNSGSPVLMQGYLYLEEKDLKITGATPNKGDVISGYLSKDRKKLHFELKNNQKLIATNEANVSSDGLALTGKSSDTVDGKKVEYNWTACKEPTNKIQFK
jgi:hypothetical protein